MIDDAFGLSGFFGESSDDDDDSSGPGGLKAGVNAADVEVRSV